MKPYQITWPIVALLSLLLPGLQAAEPDWKAYSAILQKHVRAGNKNGLPLALVDYASIKKDPVWKTVTDELASYSPARLQTRTEQLAFYINAYNILAIKRVVDHYPVKSIKDTGLLNTMWTSTSGQIGGKDHSLDQVEHKILRPMGEARIHFAIICASVSCPDLRKEPFRAATLEKQLEEQTHAFLQSPRGAIVQGNSYRLSKILDWFGKDFQKEGGVESFVLKYRPDLQGKKHSGWLNYDWALNGN